MFKLLTVPVSLRAVACAKGRKRGIVDVKHAKTVQLFPFVILVLPPHSRIHAHTGACVIGSRDKAVL